MTILTTPHPGLTKPSIPITRADKKLLQFIQQLTTTLIHKNRPQGIGLSAPQVGKNIRLFATYLDRIGPKGINVYINPTITTTSKHLDLGGTLEEPLLEGCLSIPGVLAPVYRHTWIELDFLTFSSQTTPANPGIKHPGIVSGSNHLIRRQLRLQDFEARVVQHELDHLDGILFTMRALEQKLPIYADTKRGLIPVDTLPTSG